MRHALSAFLLCLLFPALIAHAQGLEEDRPRNGLGLYLGFGTDNNFTEHFYQPWSIGFTDSRLIAASYTRRLAEITDGLDLELEIVGGYRFDEGDSLAEFAIALGARWNRFWWDDTVDTSFALFIGPSYVTKLPTREVINSGPDAPKWLNYFTPELTFAAPSWEKTEVFVRIHHRSGVFKLIDGVTGASNILAIGARQRF